MSMQSIRDGIPDDIWETASDLATSPKKAGEYFSVNYIRPVALALLAERNRKPDLIAALSAFEAAIAEHDYGYGVAPNGDWLLSCKETINLSKALRQSLDAACGLTPAPVSALMGE